MNPITDSLPSSIDQYLADFSQATNLVSYADVMALGAAWDRLPETRQIDIRNAVYAAMDADGNDPAHKSAYDRLASLVKAAGNEIKTEQEDMDMSDKTITGNPGKTIIVTAGPTNEAIDAVMKITNMSTGSLGARIVEAFLGSKDGYSCHADGIKKIYYIAQKLSRRPVVPDGQAGKLVDIPVESTEDLLRALDELLTQDDEHIDAVVHSAAVGDYTGRYAIRAEDLAREICDRNAQDGTLSYDELLSIITCPACLQDSNTKISSYEPNLMVMLDLTPKVITRIKSWSPDTLLVGFKLLENVDENTLLAAAHKVQNSSKADFVLANDLARIKSGSHDALLIGPDGSIVKRLSGKADIADELSFAVMQGPGRYRYEPAGGNKED